MTIEPPTLAELRAHKAQILDLASRHGVSNIRVIGPVARGDAAAGSSVDLLVDLEPGRGLAIFTFADDVEGLIGHHVHIGDRVPDAGQAQVAAEVVDL